MEKFSTSYVGALFQLHPRTLNKWIAERGFLPPPRVGRCFRWTTEDVERVRIICEARRVPLGTLSTRQVEEQLKLKPHALNALIGRGAPAPKARLMDTGKPRVWTPADVERIRAFTNKHANSEWKKRRRAAKQVTTIFPRVDVAAARKEAKGMFKAIGSGGETADSLLAAIRISARDQELMKQGSNTGFVDGKPIEDILLFRACIAAEFKKLLAKTEARANEPRKRRRSSRISSRTHREDDVRNRRACAG